MTPETNYRALLLPFIPQKTGAHLQVASQLSSLPLLHGLTSLPVLLPVLPAIYPDPHAILTLPSGEGRQGDCLLAECHRATDTIREMM